MSADQAPRPTGQRPISVVIPTYNRPDLLRACVAGVLAQEEPDFEVLIANDGTVAVPADVRSDPRVRVLEGPFGGPAAARNAGIGQARGELVAFTDDDTVPQPGWLAAGRQALAEAPHLVGLLGRVECPGYDPVFEAAVQAEDPGNFLTCNALYRRSALRRVGGFDQGFPYPHCEDRDLGYRLSELGELSYCPDMLVHHPARPITVRGVVHRGRFIASEWRLHLRHPQTRPPRWSVRWGPLIRLTRGWCQLVRRPGVLQGSPARAGRLAAMAAGQVALATWTTVRHWPSESAKPLAARAAQPLLRVAYLGPDPGKDDERARAVALSLQGLDQLGCQVDCYVAGIPDEVLAGAPLGRHTRMICIDTGWRRGRWYSASPLPAAASCALHHALAQRRLRTLLQAAQPVQSYDVVYQVAVRRWGLPRGCAVTAPLALQPADHAAGRLRLLQAGPQHNPGIKARAWQWAVARWLAGCARREGRSARGASRVIATSRILQGQLVADYGLAPASISVVPAPVTSSGSSRPPGRVADPLQLFLAGPHGPAWRGRLGDLAGGVVLHGVAQRSAPSLIELGQPAGEGACPGGLPSWSEQVAALQGMDLLVQDSSYQPLGNLLSQALAEGIPVVATTEVAAAEDVDPGCCLLVAPWNGDALEAAVRTMIERLRHAGPETRALARREAERLFSPSRVCALLLSNLIETARPQEALAEARR